MSTILEKTYDAQDKKEEVLTISSQLYSLWTLMTIDHSFRMDGHPSRTRCLASN